MYPNLKAELARRGVTLGDLSEELECSIGSLSAWLRGKVPLSFRNAVKIKRYLEAQQSLEMSLEELFATTEDNKKEG